MSVLGRHALIGRLATDAAVDASVCHRHDRVCDHRADAAEAGPRAGGGSGPEDPGPCTSPQTPAICSFTAATPGTYRVQVIATDPSNEPSSPASLSVVIKGRSATAVLHHEGSAVPTAPAPPPAMSTVPLGNKVAVCAPLHEVMLPVQVADSEAALR